MYSKGKTFGGMNEFLPLFRKDDERMGEVKGGIIAGEGKRENVGGEIRQVFAHKETERNPTAIGLGFENPSFIS